MVKCVLASASPRRKEILEQIGVKFEISISHKEEIITKELPSEIVEELSRQKALEVSNRFDNEGHVHDNYDTCVVIGADTIVSCDGEIMGKPHDREDAVRMLTKLQDNTHQVYTGVTLVIIKDEAVSQIITFNEKTDVSIYPVSAKKIEEYVDTGEPMDKAGAYGIQGLFAAYIKGINGDYNNVVGLPAARLVRELLNAGIEIR